MPLFVRPFACPLPGCRVPVAGRRGRGSFLLALAVGLAWLAGPAGVSPALAQGGPAPEKRAAPAQPLAGERIVAVVNEDAISGRDLAARMDIVAATSRLPNIPEVRQRLAPQILRALIDETLKLQETRRANISVGPDDIAQGVERLERQNNLPPGGLEKAFKAAGLNWDSLVRQVRAEMGWIKVVQASLVPRVSVSDDEISLYEANLRRNLGQPEYLVADIFLAVDDPAQDGEVRAAANRLIEQMREGANFAALARQFSRGPSAQRGGDLGWVGPGDVDQDVLAVLRQMNPGNLSQPVRAFGGYHILLMRDRRLAGAGQGASFPVLSRVIVAEEGPRALPAAKRASVMERLKTVRGCEAFNALAREVGPPSGPMGPVDPQRLPVEVRDVVSHLEIGEPSAPLPSEGVLAVVMVCERPQGGMPDRSTIRERLAQQKLEGLAQRRLRDLRQQAIIDVRV
ncbi:peptidylprolyl isomerase [Pararhodospirillum oryzae]|uniref:Parvulin-like PPIase n=1 Tax=Pararhodospirillum oryzae TaxID=478448 RepID=A0A512H8E1_9PROT|nr:peptidylprolyl isomerase [Pararhodospirillum oryzae]GEO81670.1 chaperone SurA [Pararhodospirillum oryzae]